MSTNQKKVLEDLEWNEDIFQDTDATGFEDLVVYSRDWTVETVLSQITAGNIDLNPKFQRRNAWNDVRRSRLIESLIVGVPVPQIVLAEEPNKKKSYIVIDGKQRLLSLAGFVNPTIDYWKKPQLKDLTVSKDLNGLTYEDLSNSVEYTDELRSFTNADVRTTIITNYQSQDVLYDIFYRLNTSSVALSTQELRQVLNKGKFADYLINITNEVQPIHEALNIDGPDPRLRDAEIILRSMAFEFFGREKYRGNIKKFLDDSMGKITKEWKSYKSKVKTYYKEFNQTIDLLLGIFPRTESGKTRIGRKYVDGKWEGRFNKVLFEVEVYYFMRLANSVTSSKNAKFVEEFKKFGDRDIDFRNSIEASTKDMRQYVTRYELFRDLINMVYKQKVKDIPLPEQIKE